MPIPARIRIQNKYQMMRCNAGARGLYSHSAPHAPDGVKRVVYKATRSLTHHVTCARDGGISAVREEHFAGESK